MRSLLALVAAALLVGSPARADEVTAESLSADSGVLVEARTVIDAAADRVAALASDPASFIELFPAVEARVVGDRGAAKMVAVRMKDHWLGLVSWVETVEHISQGATHLVEREALSSDFYKRIHATWRITPLPGSAARCEVIYRVNLDLQRWPAWMVRRGTVSGVRSTVERLRTMVERVVAKR
jgi:hypothetical protein